MRNNVSKNDKNEWRGMDSFEERWSDKGEGEGIWKSWGDVESNYINSRRWNKMDLGVGV